MPFFPPQRPTDPEDVSDLFSEALSNEYGQWQNGTPGWSTDPFLNVSQAAVPISCIAQTILPSANIGMLRFMFNNPLDMRGWEDMRVFISGVGSQGVVQLDVIMYDDQSRSVKITKQFTLDLSWQPKILFLTSFTQDQGVGFDWQHVVDWLFRVYALGGDATYYLDAGPFLYRATVTHETAFEARQNGDSVGRDITVVNNDTLETFTIPSGNSASLIQENGTSYTITAPATYFLYWEDGNTNPERIYTPTEAKTLTAYYAYPAVYELTINSEPTEGHSGDLEGFPFVTNITFPGLSSGNYEITIQDTEHFVKWEDESTNPTRTISLTSNMTVTAYFSNGNGNGDGNGDGKEMPYEYGLFAAFGISSAVLAYYLWKTL